MKTAVVIGGNSDIYKLMRPMLEKDYKLVEIYGDTQSFYTSPSFDKWDLMLIPMGRVAPVGNWWEMSAAEFDACVSSNILRPMNWLRLLWYWRNPNPSVCFFAGSNPNKPMAGYTPYHLGKMALLKTVEQLDFETPDAKFFALAPGYVPTKIHKPTLEKGWKNERIEKGGGTKIEDIYLTLNWCLSQPKEVVGGRNICVSDLQDFDPLHLAALSDNLLHDQSKFKLRRQQ